MGTDEIVLLDEDGRAVGTAPRLASHHEHTPLHLAFSCYIVDDRDRVLLTRRAATKRTFPNVLTNSCCGHPRPGEAVADAVRRRVHEELGIELTDIQLVLPGFRYRAVMDNGIVEYEWCPVFRAHHDGPLDPDPAEVGRTAWLPWAECLSAAAQPDASPWFREQVAALRPLGEPRDWPAGDPAELPPAAR